MTVTAGGGTATATSVSRRVRLLAGYPPRLRTLILVMAVLGIGSLGVSVASLRSAPPLGPALLVAAFCAIGDMALVNIRFGHNRYSFTWSELAVVLGLVMLPSAWFVVVMCAAVAIAEGLLRRPLVKQLFNDCGMAVAAGLARLVCVAFGVADPARSLDEPRTWVVLAVATAVFALWNDVTVGMAVAFSQRLRVLSVLRAGALLQVVVWMGNTVAGLGAAIVAKESSGAYVVLPFFLGILYYSYFAYLRLAEDRDSWQVLQDTSAELARLARSDIATVTLDRAQQLFRADFAELLLVDSAAPGQAAAWTRTEGRDPVVRRDIAPREAGTYWPRAESERELFVLRRDDAPPVQRDELNALGLNSCVVLPLTAADECLGALRLGFRGPVRLRRREEQVLRTFGAQLAASVQNARLFEQTREERAKLRRVVDNTSDGILSVDASGRITSWNPAMAAMTGVPESAVLGAPFTLGPLASDESGAPIGPDWLWTTLGDLPAVPAKVRVVPGDERWLALSIASVRHDGGGIDTVVVVARDVTALHQAGRAKEEFLATVSHELRTPLTSLKGWVLTLLRPEYRPDDEERAEIHQRLLRQVARLQRLIEDLLSVSALDEGELVTGSMPVAVDDVVDKVLSGIAAEHPDRPVSHQRAGLAGLALADPGRLEQVLGHLVSNAVKFSPHDSPIKVSVVRHDGEVELVVTDQGYGIPADRLEDVFECFTRLGDYMTREQQGAGVGLHIARRLVQAMGGRIWAESEVGVGTRMHVRLPAAPLMWSRHAG